MALSLISSRAVKSFLYYELLRTSPPSWVSDVSGTVIPSDQPSEEYVGVGAVNPMRRWIGNRMANTLRAETYTLANQKYEDTLLVLGDERRRDKTGQVMRRINDLRGRYGQHWERLTTEVIMLGESTACYDGQFFFDTDHSSGSSGTQDNDITVAAATSTTWTSAELRTAIWSGIEQLMPLKDDAGEPINAGNKSWTIIHPPSMSETMAGALNAPLVGGGDTNTLQVSGHTFTVEANAWLQIGLGGVTGWGGSNADKIAIFANSGRAIIRQEEVPLMVTAKAEGSDFEHDTDNHEYGVMTSRAVGYGAWQSACLVTAT